MDVETPKEIYKVIVVGDGGIGKICLTRRFTSGKFSASYKMTVGLQISAKTLMSDSDLIKLVIWDTAGQEHFAPIRPKYYSGAAGALIGFNLNDKNSLDNVPKWVDETLKVCPKLPIVLTGLKSDIKPQVSRRAIQEVADQYSLPVIYTSSKDDLFVDKPFSRLIELIQGNFNPCPGIPLQL